MGDRFGIFGAVIRIRKLSLLFVMTLRIPNRHLKSQIGKNLNMSIPYVGSINAKIKPNPETDPIEEVMAVTP